MSELIEQTTGAFLFTLKQMDEIADDEVWLFRLLMTKARRENSSLSVADR